MAGLRGACKQTSEELALNHPILQLTGDPLGVAPLCDVSALLGVGDQCACCLLCFRCSVSLLYDETTTGLTCLWC